jgi:hypothetical protein
MLFWNSEKNKPYKAAKYTPVLFKHKIKEIDFSIFQTIEMVDFKNAINPKNIDLFINESGLFIAHTYFSVDMNHYSGKLFKDESNFDPEVVANFDYLSQKIKDNSIWNPTLSDLKQHLNTFEETIFDIVNGEIIVKGAISVPSRKVK